MRITKYNQACLLIEVKNKRILVDPGNIGYTESRLNDWNNIDIILVTHKHSDHCNKDAIETIMARDHTILYTTTEVGKEYGFKNYNNIKENDVIVINDIKIEVVKAIHGYLPGMREKNIEIKENVGYIIDDSDKRIYITSDTIGFYNDYKCDILCMPFNGNGLTLGIIDGIMFAKDINPGIVIPIHTEHPNPIMNPNIEKLKLELKEAGLNYKILNNSESINF